MTQDEMKKASAVYAVDKYVKSSMKIGLGTGSTAKWVIKEVAARLKSGQLKDILAVSTSFQTTLDCQELGIPLADMNSPLIAGELDLAIDGADEVDSQNYLTKGGGGAQLAEKIVAYSARQFIVVVDQSKMVDKLGAGFPVPVEVLPAARVCAVRDLVKLGAVPEIRMAVKKAGPLITDNGNLIVDCRFEPIADPKSMETLINSIPGVIENGLFTKGRYIIVTAAADGRILERN